MSEDKAFILIIEIEISGDPAFKAYPQFKNIFTDHFRQAFFWLDPYVLQFYQLVQASIYFGSLHDGQ